MPRPYVFGETVGIDVIYPKDSAGKTCMFLNIVDLGTNFQVVCPIREGHGIPTSKECLDAFMQHWVSWAGFPKELVCDRGLNNRGVFAKTLAAAHVYISNVGLEAPYQIGKVERRGGIWKGGLPSCR